MNYTNEICNGCGRKFVEDDDIVVCPECGTPQHRECWNNECKCVNEHLHEDGFEWRPKHTETKTHQEKITEKRPCPFCGHENPIDAKECENCSQPFSMFGMSVFPKEKQQEENGERSEYSYKPPFKVDYEEPAAQNGYMPLGSESYEQSKEKFIFNNETYDNLVLGVETKDFASYIRTSVSSYYKKFKKFENGKRFSFNFAAFVFGPLWFFFRKIYKAGIIFLTVSLCLTMAFYSPISQAIDKYSSLMEQFGEVFQSQEEPDEQLLEEATQKLYVFMEENGAAIYGYLGAVLAKNIIAALIADSLYKKKFLADMENIKEESQGINEQRYILILKKGGVSFFVPFLAYAAMQLLSSLLLKVFFE